MKTESTVKYVLRLTVTLLLITGAVAAALAGVNAITKDAIAANQEKKTQDALAGHPIEILRLEWMPIHHCVFVKDGDVGVTKLISHVQALMQSERTLRELYPDAEFVECEDTAYAAEMLSNGTIGSEYAAVCRKDAGEHYGLTLVHENVEDNRENMTQFAIVRKV